MQIMPKKNVFVCWEFYFLQLYISGRLLGNAFEKSEGSFNRLRLEVKRQTVGWPLNGSQDMTTRLSLDILREKCM